MDSKRIKIIINSIGHDTFIKYCEIFKSKRKLTAEDVAAEDVATDIQKLNLKLFNSIIKNNKLKHALKMAKECQNFNKEIKDV